MTASASRSALLARIALAVGGGFGLASAVSAAAALALPLATGMARAEAVLLSAMLAFPLYLVLLLWGFAERRLGRVALVMLGGAAAAWTLARLLAGGGHA